MKSVIKGTGYILVHTPDMVLHNGTTQTTERIVNPDSEYLKELPKHIRSYEQTLRPSPGATRSATPRTATASSARSCPRRSSCC